MSLRAFERQEPSSTFYNEGNKSLLITRLDKLTDEVKTELKRQGFEGDRVHVERMLNMRFEGTDTALMVLPDVEKDGHGEDYEAAFKRVYKSEFGFILEGKAIIVDDIKVTWHFLVVSCPSHPSSLLGPWNWEDIRHSWGIRL